MISNEDKKSLQYIENAIKNGQKIDQKGIDMIEEQFSMYAYLKSLLEMRKESQL